MAQDEGAGQEMDSRVSEQLVSDLRSLLPHADHIAKAARDGSSANETAHILLQKIEIGQPWTAFGALLTEDRDELEAWLNTTDLSPDDRKTALAVLPENEEERERLRDAVIPVIAHKAASHNAWRRFAADTTLLPEHRLPLMRVVIKTEDDEETDTTETTLDWLDNVNSILRAVAQGHHSLRSNNMELPPTYRALMQDRFVACLQAMSQIAKTLDWDIDELLKKASEANKDE